MEDLLSDEKAIQESNSWLEQKIFETITEDVYQRGSFSVCILHASAKGREYEGVGFSKVRPDISIAKYDPERGKQISRGRATHDLYLDYQRNIK